MREFFGQCQDWGLANARPKQAPDASFDDIMPGRKGEWQQTSLGGRFYPLDPRQEEVFISDIANGLALDCRYSGQGMVGRFYSVAEHSVLMARYAFSVAKWPPLAALAVLLHDAPEAYLNDLSRAVKHAVGSAYTDLEANIGRVIDESFGVTPWRIICASKIKTIDRRMVPVEKVAIMRYPQPWAFDQYQPLEGVNVQCWAPPRAKREFLDCYLALCKVAKIAPQEVVYE
ncbi:MAG TPA: hypothetical protein VFE77_03070 [Rhodanobacter sp.]|nr:hypothetical protein [Rhodanobacter sp.]